MPVLIVSVGVCLGNKEYELKQKQNYAFKTISKDYKILLKSSQRIAKYKSKPTNETILIFKHPKLFFDL